MILGTVGFYISRMSRLEHSDDLGTPPSISVGSRVISLAEPSFFSLSFPMLRILVSVATYIGILNTIIIILYSHRQGRNSGDQRRQDYSH
jgi:hypothetical protein